jgi:hypothetical protein
LPVSEAPAAPIPFLGDRRHRQAHPSVGAAEQHCQALCVGPFAELARADVGLVLVVRRQELDGLAERGAAEVGDRHFDPLDRSWTIDVRIEARQIVNVPDTDLSAA